MVSDLVKGAAPQMRKLAVAFRFLKLFPLTGAAGGEGGEETGGVGGVFCAGAEDILVRKLSFGHARGEIGDAGEGSDPQAAVAGHEDLGNGAHANGVSAELSEGANLGGGFVGRAGNAEVNAF